MATYAPSYSDTARADAAGGGSLAEPLEAQARLAWRLAADTCARAAGPEPGCAWYHGVYPTLRLLGLAATPERHARFFSDALQRSALAGSERVLISGAADTAMLAQVLAVYGVRGGARPRVQVLDRCETPLQLCRDYAGRVGCEIETRRLDLLDPQARRPPARAFDLICTHSLLAFFTPDARREVIAAWRAQLRSGGQLVSTLRIEPEPRRADVARSHERALRERALARAASWPGALAAPPEQIADAALRYAARLRGWPAASADELALLLVQGGFALEQLDVVDVPGSAAAPDAGAGTARSATYAEFVARRL